MKKLITVLLLGAIAAVGQEAMAGSFSKTGEYLVFSEGLPKSSFTLNAVVSQTKKVKANSCGLVNIKEASNFFFNKTIKVTSPERFNVDLSFFKVNLYLLKTPNKCDNGVWKSYDAATKLWEPIDLISNPLLMKIGNYFATKDSRRLTNNVIIGGFSPEQLVILENDFTYIKKVKGKVNAAGVAKIPIKYFPNGVFNLDGGANQNISDLPNYTGTL
jgi:hypothetical protein